MHHFFIKKTDIVENIIQFPSTEHAHITRVLRLKAGETVSATDGENIYLVKLTEVDDIVKGEIEHTDIASHESPLYTILIQGIAKGEKMDFIVQKATELGINEIIPVETRFSVVKLDAKKKKDRAERWQKIAHGAAKQSKRTLVPLIHIPMTLKEALEAVPKDILKIVLWESEQKKGLRELLNSSTNNKLALLVGPEGGLSPEEVELVDQYAANTVTLGKRILRTETAGLAALAIVQYALGDLGGSTGAH